MNISFENIVERDIDLLIIRQFSMQNSKMMTLFGNKVKVKNAATWELLQISHSVMTGDGESDVEAVFTCGEDRIAFLIEDKIDAIAQPEQAQRYRIRAEKAVEAGRFDKYYIFIVAPQKYLDGNREAHLYPNQISYEEIYGTLNDAFDKAVMQKALDESKHGYVPVEDQRVTEFWNRLYDFVDEKFPNTFLLSGKKGESRGTNARWILIKSGKGTNLQIKADRGYVDLEISGYADKFQEFSKNNQDILDSKKLYLRLASKSLAIRSYVEPIDFEGDFDAQITQIEVAFLKAKELMDLVKYLKY